MAATAAASSVTAMLSQSITSSSTTTTSSSSTSSSFSSFPPVGMDSVWFPMPGLTARVPKRRNAEQRPRLSMRLEMPRRRPSGPSSRKFPIPAAAGAELAEEEEEGSAEKSSSPAAAAAGQKEGKVIHGKCFVVGDNIDTDQIIPAEYLTLVPSKPDEYEKLGSYAMIGLPPHYGKFIQDGEMKTEYTVMIGGANFGCGSSREHAPVAMGAAGIRAVVAESYARIFFRNSVATGELYPVETEARICEQNKTGDLVTVDLGRDVLINHTSGKQFSLIPIGDAGPVIDAGGIFNFARASGMIAAPA